MKPISLAEVRRITGAEGTGAENAATGASIEIRDVSTDTRRPCANSLFIALRGDTFDAHEFLRAAATAGAVAALVDREVPDPPANLRLIRVDDTRRAMGRLAAHVRRQLRGKVIAVAGSNGKTGTKHLIHSVLRDHFRGSMSPKSFNNDIGVPLAIFPADIDQDYLVLELGTNHPGEIRPLTEIARPDIAVITNCSAEHLEGLGDLAGVRRENAAIIEGLSPAGALIVHGDDPHLLQNVAPFRGDCVTFGLNPGNELWASKIRCDWQGVYFTIEPAGIEAFVPLLGKHTAVNALAAVAVGRVMGMSDRDIVRHLASATGPDMRLQRLSADGVQILNDAYNANPASMRAALETLAALPAQGRKIAVLGEMRELGDASESCHREIGRFLAEKAAPDMLLCVGAAAAAIAREAARFGLAGNRIALYPDASAASALAPRLSPGDVVLLKASRAVGLEVVARAILSSRPQPLSAAS